MTRKALWATFAAAFLGWMFDGLEMGLFPLASAPILNDVVGAGADAKPQRDAWNARITASFLVGAAAGGVLFGWLGDRIGRVRAMSLSIACYGLFTGAIYFVHSVEALLALRFLASLGMGGEWALGVALVMECWPAAQRPLLAGCIGAAANVGFTLIALVSLLHPVTDHDWRWVMLAGAAPALLTLFVQFAVPESRAWLATRNDPAPKVDPLREALGPELRGTTWRATVLAGVALVGTWGSVQQMPRWVSDEVLKDVPPAAQDDSAAQQARARRLSDARAWTQIASGVGAILGSLAGPLLGAVFGRRVVYFGLCTASVAAVWATFRMTEYGPALLAMVGLCGATTAAFYGWLPLYLPELFPTRVRATGQGFAFNMGRLVAAVGVFQLGALQTWRGSQAAAASLLALVYVVGMVAIWFVPETKGRPLPA
jgi:MFS transporter, SHS family, sialic acid transporter